MKITMLHEGSESRRLLLIAAGWSTEPQFYRHVYMPGWDTAVITGFGMDGIDIVKHQLQAYATVYLYAWSLGVALAERIHAAGVRFTACFAINGTAQPVDDGEGIPMAVFRSTCELLTPQNLRKFRCRMCGGQSAFRLLADRFDSGADDIEGMKNELREFDVPTSRCMESVPWNLAFVGRDDAIFPASSQMRHWHRRGVEIAVADSPHYIDVQTVVEATVVDVFKAGRRFARSADTYSRHAVAQHDIALELATRTAACFAPSGRVATMLEVGCGSGELSRALGGWLEIAQATYVDLYRCGPFGVAARERCLEGDAELLLECMEERFELICSSSAMQWFSDTERFLANCERHLQPGGVLALSTFTRGNMRELDAVRRSTIGYLDCERLRELAQQYFTDIEMEQKEIVLRFDTPEQLMRHLQYTGVTASSATRMSPMQLRRIMRCLPTDGQGRYTLTFKPVFLTARKQYRQNVAAHT